MQLVNSALNRVLKKQVSKVQRMNVGAIIFNNYCLILFTDYVEDPYIRSFIGWIESLCIILVVVINVGLVLGTIIKAVLLRTYLRCKEKFKKKEPEPVIPFVSPWPEPDIQEESSYDEEIDLADPA
jgi:hypothetical protein